jgi:hypothetical protein
MSRFFYACLLRLHPRRFRQRFAEEMLWIFDQTSPARSRAALFADGLLSLFRQWALRPEFQQEPQPLFDGLPMFYTGGSDTPRAGALLEGAVLSLFIFGAVCYVLSHSNSHARLMFQLGSHNHSFSHFLETHTVSAAPKELSTQVKLKPEPKAHPVSEYFRMMPVLMALDTDKDGIISAAEIAHATVALLTLDKNHDNQLNAEECGFGAPHPTLAMRRDFMRLHPVLAALDANHDGELSANEILNAPAALLILDKNRDGQLTEDELIPDPRLNDEILRRSRQRPMEHTP